MKKYLLISAAVLALASCQNDDSVVAMYNGVEVDTEAEILMQQAVIGSTMSKVGIEGKVFPTDTIFGTKAYYLKGKKWYDSEATLYIDDDSIAYDTAAAYKTFRNLNKHYYWPKSGKLTFLSYFPHSLKNQVSAGTDGKYKVTDFVVEDGTSDLMLADIKADMTTNDTQKGVTTTFRHKLTKIGVQARLKKTVDTAAVEITIKEIEFVGALSKGTLTGAGAVNDSLKLWDKTGYRNNYEYADTSIVLKRWIDNTGADSTANWYEEMGKDQLILMPQDSAEMYTGVGKDSVALRVKYIYSLKGANRIDEENVKVINVATMPNAKDWDINKYVVYRLEFDAEEILFDPAVVDFDAPEIDVDHEIK